MPDTENTQRRNGDLVGALGGAIEHGANNLGMVPALMKRLLREEAWRDFETALHEHIHHDRFEAFVHAQPLAGLGCEVAYVRQLLANDVEALDLLDQALQHPVGHPSINNNVIDSAPQGNSADRALRTLREKRPDLHTRVLAGELSPHAAMIEAGFRRPTMTVPLDDMRSLASTLVRRLAPTQRAELAAALKAIADFWTDMDLRDDEE